MFLFSAHQISNLGQITKAPEETTRILSYRSAHIDAPLFLLSIPTPQFKKKKKNGNK